MHYAAKRLAFANLASLAIAARAESRQTFEVVLVRK
jgi:hypothetical protein